MSAAGVIDGFLGTTLLYAALAKAVAGEEFVRSLTAIRMLRPVAPTVAAAILLAEGLVGICLTAGLALWLARPAAVTILAAFAVILFGAWIVGLISGACALAGEGHSVRQRPSCAMPPLALFGAYTLLAPAEGRHLAR